MKKTITVFYVLAALVAVSGCKRDESSRGTPGNYQRVVPLSPSLSETLYALGLGDRVVGVTAFARYPEEVKQKPKIGGYSDINIEAVYALKPDLVLALEQQEDTVRQLRALKIEPVQFKNETIGDITILIRRIGTLFDRSEKAEELCAGIEAEKKLLAENAKSKPRRRVLVSVGRNMGNGKIGNVYAAGPGTLFGEIITLAGGENVYQGTAPYASLSQEAILRLNPEVIIDLIPDMDTMKEYTQAAALEQWEKFGKVDAVLNKNVTINMSSYICIPGPRITLMMRDIARAIHPDLQGSEP
jgi:iron complex transport system substrate-binding protein